jgi:Holliday junction resolvasome RuvABC DNA-binding subunit
VELRDKAAGAPLTPKAAATPAALDRALDDVVSALVNLGCNRKEAQQAAETARTELGPGAAFEELIKAALRGVGDQRT